ncbi:MAG: integrase core domain-containing protein, partial [Planctomycetota bacterium]|nr:integrase core domain-containing protein [Planctomycetota bacterium]
MHEALLLVARAIALAHDRWRRTVGRRRPLSGKIAILEERVQRLEVESDLLRARFLRLPPRRRPHYRPHERLEILWHAARYRLSIAATAHTFCVTQQTVINWRRVVRRKHGLLPPMNRLSDVVHELVHRLKHEWPRWGTRRIAGQLSRLGVKTSRSSVQRIVRQPRAPRPEDHILPTRYAGLLARRPNHIWMIDFTRLGGVVRPVFVGAVIDAYSRKVLAIGFIRGEPNSNFAMRLLREAIDRRGARTWLVSDKDRALGNKLVNALFRRRGIRRRYGAVGRKGSIAIIERMWRSMKQEYVHHLFLYRSSAAIEKRLRRWARWHNTERPHQGLGQRTPDDV